MFATGENFVRTICFPEVYLNFFKEHCQDIIVKYQSRIENLATVGQHFQAAGIRTLQGVLLGVSTVPQLRGAIVGIKALESQMPKGVEYLVSKSELKQKCEREIDLRCAKIANDYINLVGA